MDFLSISRAARETPAAPFLIIDGKTWLMGHLAERVGSARRLLEERELTRDARVAIRATNRLETIIALLALIEEGRTIVPIHPRLTDPEVLALLSDARPQLFIDEHQTVEMAKDGPGSALPPPPDPSTTLAILYTSGTTGKPKGAMLPRSAFLAAAKASEQNLGWGDQDRWLLCLPVCHVGGLSILTRCLIARKPLILHWRFDPEGVLTSIVRDRATMLSVVPTMLARLLETDRDNVLARLRVVLVGGAGAPRALMEECARRGIPALATYGLTEACSQVTTQPLRRPPVAEPGSGTALPGVGLRIVDSSEGIGRIQVSGPTLMSGYWGHPPIDGWFDTGDLGSLDADGRLQVAARRTDLIVTGGENVYPAEVEQVLASLPGVKDALVFGLPDEQWGQVVAAAVVGDLGEEARAALAERLAPHKRPKRFCLVDALPVTGAGKPDRTGAAEMLAARMVRL
jgi:O-succinylbenzoic acid--CoA ligase